MNRRFIILALFLVFLGGKSFSQTEILVPALKADSIPIFTLHDVEIIDKAPSKKEMRKYKKGLVNYQKLYYHAAKVWPYVLEAEIAFKRIQKNVGHMKKKDRKKYVKTEKKVLFSKFEKKLRNLTQNDAKVLFKLIDRQTAHTSYDMIAELNGKFSAFLWQGVAKLFGNNLKTDFDPEKDKQLDQIARILEKKYKS